MRGIFHRAEQCVCFSVHWEGLKTSLDRGWLMGINDAEAIVLIHSFIPSYNTDMYILFHVNLGLL